MKHPFSKIFGQGENEEVTDDLSQEQIQEIPIAQIIPNQYQPRTMFSDDRIDELAQTIETHGMIQPIVVRRTGFDEYEIIAGERRWRAVQQLGWEQVQAIIKEYDDTQTAAVALIENLQREELTSVEEAMAYAKLMDLHGLTQEILAEKLGKGQSTIANKLRLLKLPTSVQNALLNRDITERHARALIGLKAFPESQEKLLEEILEKQLNVKQTEDRVQQLKEKANKPKSKPKRSKRVSLSKDMRIALNTIRQSVDMVSDTGVNIDTAEEDNEEYYQFTIRIPKNK